MQNIQTLLKPYQSLIVAAITVLFAAAGILIGVVPLGKKALELQKENVAAAREIATLRAKNEILSSVDEETLRTSLLTLAAAVPPEKSLATLFDGIDAVTATTGVSVTSLTLARAGSLATESAKKITADEKEAGASILPFSLTVEGSFDQVRQFLATIVSIRRFFRIRSVELSINDVALVIAHVNMDTFYSPLPTSIGSVGTTITTLTEQESETIAKTSAIQLVSSRPTEVVAPSEGAGKADLFSP